MKYFHPKRLINKAKAFPKFFFTYYLIPDSWYLKWKYKKVFGAKLNLKNPQKFTEKMQWLKLHDRKELYRHLVDKYEVKGIISNLLGEEYIIPTIGKSYSDLSQVDFDLLPDKFVIKCNHDSGSVIVCKDKKNFNKEEADKKIRWCMSHDYYHFENKQWAYKGIKRCFFIEEYLEDSETHDLPDYKFFCFNGEVRCIFVVRDRFTYGAPAVFFDKSWNKLPFALVHPMYKGTITRPDNLDKMMEIAEKIARFIDNPFTRIDLYDVNGQVYFGEVTFYPDGGMGLFEPEEWDYTLGSWINLNQRPKYIFNRH